MNPLALLPLLAAAAMAAPGVLLNQPGVLLNQQGVLLNQQAIGYAQVPLTQTIHYQNQPVVTGYTSTVVKPALAHAPLALSGIPSHYIYGRQIDVPTAPPNDFITPPPTNGTIGDNPITPPPGVTPPPTNGTIGDNPITPPPGIPELPGQPTSAPPPSENGTSGDQGGQNPTLPIPGSPILGGGVNLLQVANPVQLQYSNLAIPQTLAVQNTAAVIEARSVPVAAVRAAQAGDFEPLVTKEKVLAPVRTHTQITPQYTQIQPEITVRKIVHDVPVHTPVAVHTPVVQQLVQGHTLVHGAKVIAA